MRRLFTTDRYAAVVSTVALVIALGGGTAYAATLITSKDIKNGAVKRVDLANGAVNSAKVANGSLLAGDFKAGQLPAGPQGPQGPAGAAGAAGAPGATGARGPSNAYVARQTGNTFITLPQNTATTVGTLNVPAGTYVVWAKALANNNEAADRELQCSISGGGASDDLANYVTIGNTDDREIVLMTMPTTFAAAGTLTFSCTSNATSSNVAKVNITALQVETVTTTVIP